MSRQRSHVTGQTRGRARQLRRGMTPAETVLWRRLRDHQIFGVKFRRQVPIEPYIVDFCCPECRLVVETDGDTHAETGDRDAIRTAQLEELGYRVIRFTNRDVHENLDGVLNVLLTALQPTAPSP